MVIYLQKHLSEQTFVSQLSITHFCQKNKMAMCKKTKEKQTGQIALRKELGEFVQKTKEQNEVLKKLLDNIHKTNQSNKKTTK